MSELARTLAALSCFVWPLAAGAGGFGVPAHEPESIGFDASAALAEEDAARERDAPCPALRKNPELTSGCDGCHANRSVSLEWGALERETIERDRRSALDRQPSEALQVSAGPSLEIVHEPPARAARGEALMLSAELIPWDGTTVANVLLRKELDGPFKAVRMTRGLDGGHRALLPGERLDVEHLEYYLEVRHRGRVFRHGSAQQPHFVLLDVPAHDGPLRDLALFGIAALAVGIIVVSRRKHAEPAPSPRRRQRQRRAGAAGLLLAFGLGASDEAFGQERTYVGVARYDRYHAGNGSSSNRNRVYVVDSEGAPATDRYVFEDDTTWPRRRERRSNRGLAFDVWPHPDSDEADDGKTYIRYVYTTDTQNHRIRRFELDEYGSDQFRLRGNASPSQYLREYGTYGDALDANDPRFAYPRDIAVHPVNHDVFVVDTGNSRIQVFELDGSNQLVGKPISVRAARSDGGGYGLEQVNAVGSHGFGSRRDRRDPPPPPLDELGNMAPTDDGGSDVGVAELGQAEFYNPQCIALDVDPGLLVDSSLDDVTYLYVADTFNHRVQVFRDAVPGSNTYEFEFVRMIGGYGIPDDDDPAEGLFRYPKGLDVYRNPVVIGDVRLYVADALNERIQVFDKDFADNFTFRRQWGDETELVDLQDLEVEGNSVYVTDPLNSELSGTRDSRVLKFDLEGVLQAQLGSELLSSDSEYAYGLSVVTVDE